MLIYKVDSSKLVKIGEEGYLPGQEQAKTYFDHVPQNEEFKVETLSENITEKIAEMLGLNVDVKKGILLSVDNKDSDRVAMTAYYISAQCHTCRPFTVSYAHCPAESNYPLADAILGYIEETIGGKQEQKAVDSVLAYAVAESNRQSVPPQGENGKRYEEQEL